MDRPVEQVRYLLQKLFQSLWSKKLLAAESFVDEKAQVPVIACVFCTEDGLGKHGTSAGITLGTSHIIDVSKFVACQIIAQPPLRPVLLVLKALVKVPSFAPVNMLLEV